MTRSSLHSPLLFHRQHVDGFDHQLDFVADFESQVVESEAYVTGRWRYERIDDADHWIPLTAPDRLTSLLLDWLG